MNYLFRKNKMKLCVTCINNKLRITLFFIFPIILFIFSLSCENEGIVKPVSQGKSITGRVADSITRAPLKDVKVTINLKNNDDTYSSRTDENGYFKVDNIPVLPYIQEYNVKVESFGYNDVLKYLSCNCISLNAGDILLYRLICQIKFNPSPLNFGYVATGKDTTLNAEITNPTLLSLNVNQIIMEPSIPEISMVNTPSVPFTLAPNEKKQFQVKFMPQSEKLYQTKIKAVLDCSAGGNSDTCTILGSGETPKCSYSITPNPPLVFQYGKVGQTDNAKITIKNLSSGALLQVKIDDPGKPFSISNTNIITIPAGKEEIVYLYFTPDNTNNYQPFSADLKITTNGSCSGIVNIQGQVEKPTCSISVIQNPIEFTNVIRGFSDTAFVLVKNNSKVADLVYNSTLPNSPFSIIPGIYPRTIKAGKLDTIYVIFSPTDTLQHVSSIDITSNGDCSKTIQMKGNSINLPGIVNLSLDKWSCPTNPEFEFRGLRFSDGKIVSDSVNLCGNTGSCIPGFGVFGQAIADLRFDGYYSGKTSGRLQAANGLKIIGNSESNPLPFKPENWKSFNISSWPDKCLTAKIGDIIAIRTRDNKYAVIRITNFFATPSPDKYERVNLDYMYPIEPSLLMKKVKKLR
jgi:hypothetical protein